MAVGPASAADKLSLGLGGYMEQWFGYANRDDTNVDKDGKSVSDGGFDTQSDAEVYFVGSLESDMGLKYSVVVELEGNQNADKAAEIDESFLRVSGEFGNLEFGARDHALVRMHHGTNDVGIGLRAGDTQKWFPGAYLDTAGHVHSGGDDVKLNYISPRISGLEVGLSYAPDSSNENAVTGAPNGNDEASWGVGLNFTQPFGDGSVTLSLGHQVLGAASAPVEFMPAAAPGVSETDMRLTVSNHKRHTDAIKAFNKGSALEPVKKGGTVELDGTITADAVAAQNAINDATSSMAKGGDSTFTNFGVGVGFGAFHFNVSYATFDSGAYTTMDANVPVTPQEVADNANGQFNAGTSMTDAGVLIDPTHTVNNATESASNNDPDNDNPMWRGTRIVEDNEKSFDVWGVSVTYTDGPMALSLGHMVHETDAGTERTATMFSAAYTLAPGVAWKSSIFGVEDNTADLNDDKMKDTVEGTGFVTGLRIDF